MFCMILDILNTIIHVLTSPSQVEKKKYFLFIKIRYVYDFSLIDFKIIHSRIISKWENKGIFLLFMLPL